MCAAVQGVGRARAETRAGLSRGQNENGNPSDGTVPFPRARLRGRAGAVIDGGRPREGMRARFLTLKARSYESSSELYAITLLENNKDEYTLHKEPV